MKVRRLLSVVAVVVSIFCGRDLSAQATDVIRGRVIGPDSLPVVGATVTATSISGNVSRNARTDRNGNFSISFPNGDGDYIVSFAAMGYAGRRFQVKRTADQEVLLADAKLQRSAVTLDAMKVEQPRQRPGRNDAMSTDISGSERGLGGGILGLDQMGDLAAMAGSLPGFSYIPASAEGSGGFSVFGLDAAQNLTTLNGLPSSADGLPRDASVTSSVSTSPYDVARGGFSGGAINVRTRSGNNFIRRSLSFVGQAPQATWTDATGRASGAQQTMGSLGGTLSGPIRFNKAYYTTSFQFNNTTRDLLTLMSQTPSSFLIAGVSPDSANRAMNQFAVRGIPQTAAGVPGDNLTRSGSFVGALDFTPPTSNTGAAYNITFNGNFNRNTPAFLNSLDLPSRGAEQSGWQAGVQGRHNAYFGFGVLTETNIGVAASGSEMDPFLRLPAGTVRVASDFGGTAPVVRNLGFGGNQGRSSSSNLNQSFFNTLSWFSRNNKHRIKMTTELNYSHSSSSSFNNEYGTFTYQSLADLAANTPSSYTRQLTPRNTSIGNVIGGWSLGDSYRPNQDLQVQYGIRVDGNRFTTLPTRNAAVETAFGVRNDKVPTPVYFSPRLGFTRTLGTAPEVVLFDGAFRAPRMVLNGGIGVFQSWANTSGLGQAIANNGLPSGIQQLSCIGAATPTPDWSDLTGSVFDVCANGVGASEFANTAPNVALFSQDFVSPRSLRSNLSWRGFPLNGRFASTVNAQVSYNMNQPGNFDLNFNPAPQFTLDNEGGRPVFVKTTSIVPSSGLISSRDAKVSSAFNRVTEMRSDLTSHSEQLQFSLSPFNWNYSWSWNLGYTLQNTRDQVRGFSSTAGDPREVAWGRSAFDARHDIRFGLNYSFFNAIRVNWNQGFRSGTPFTPMVAGDVNGDGYLNDRAFVFDPASTSDPAVKSGMETLLASGPSAARDCLRGQLGKLADRASCEGPWTANASLSISLDPVRTRLPRRMGLSFSISNPLGAADMLLHGEDDMRGWGQAPQPDNTLLSVKGFDPATQRYTYEVNQRFGSTSLQQTLSRNPVRIVMQARFDVGPATERQMLTQQLDRGRSIAGMPKVTEQNWKAQYSSGPVFNPLRQILTQADSMQLTRIQADSIASLNRWYTVRLDSIWTPIAKFFAEMPVNYDQDLAYDRYREGREASVDLLIRIAPAVRGILTPAQTRKLGFLSQFLDTRYLAYIRSGTASGGGPMGFAPIGAAMMEVAMASGGGMAVTIIR
ncbi:MAG TPA: carboxypeptidase-like regulatory domain-containing protein [Gemmatimonadaceae bacterium]|nr:carboxypeptidase-like regulatory domain-containing protein [Gemmatimonadaceae bacterium]